MTSGRVRATVAKTVAGLLIAGGLLLAARPANAGLPGPLAGAWATLAHVPSAYLPRRAASSAAAATAQAPASAATPPVTDATSSSTDSTAATDAAIRAVIQQANVEQQQAFARQDPTIMQDTATSSYYGQLVQIARDMQRAGVSAVKLVTLTWGPVSVQGTGAQATTYETWQTTLNDGSTQQDRQRNVYTLVQQGGGWKVQADDHPDANLNQSSGAGANPNPVLPSPGVLPALPAGPSAAPAPMPVPVVPAVSTGSGESHNWSGYAATGGVYTAVQGSWKVPQVTSNGGFASDATWVGIGGVTSRDLIQAGTDATVQGSQVRYTAWLEMLPQVSQPVALTVSPGDTVSVAITQQPDGAWLIAFQNQTTGQRYQTSETYASSRSSAEWVEEAPAGGRRVLPLDNFGTVQFTAGSAVKDGRPVSVSQAGARPITMLDFSGRPIAQPSALGSDGASFSVSRLADSPATVPGAGFGRQPYGSGGQGYGRSPSGRYPRGGRGGGR